MRLMAVFTVFRVLCYELRSAARPYIRSVWSLQMRESDRTMNVHARRFRWQRAILTSVALQSLIASAFGDTATVNATEDSGAFYSMFISLVMILGAAVAATFFLRRWKGGIGRSDGPLRLLHVIALGPRERLALVKVGEKYLVLGITPTSINKISDVSDIGENLVSPPETPKN
jgi:flagellar protein FliO/FliZ